MYAILMIPLIVGYIFSLCISLFTLIHIFRNRNKYGSILNAILNFFTIFNACIIYSTLYVFSIIFYFSEIVNITLWKLSIISGFVSVIITAILYSFLKEYKKIPNIPFLAFSILFGLLVAALFSPQAIQLVVNKTSKSAPYLITDTSNINFYFDLSTGLIVAIFQLSILIYYFYISIFIHTKTRNKTLSKGLIINTVIFAVPILMYIFYVIFRAPIFRELHIILLWVSTLGVCIMLIRKPDMFLVLTNKIYYINIYHKSGILLYSYKFEKTKNETDSDIWGNILIGINHILSEFVNPKNQIDVLQTKSRDIIVDYDNEYGFAVLVITNQKNLILEKMMANFKIEFKNKFKDELNEIQDLNKIINVAEFTGTKKIIENNFQIYVSNL